MMKLQKKLIPLAMAMAALVAADTARAWPVITQNSDSMVWSGYASAVNNLLNQSWHPTAVDVNYTAWNNSYSACDHE